MPGAPPRKGQMPSTSHYRQQLRLLIGDEAFDAIPDAEQQRQRPPVQRRPRIEARQRIVLSGLVPARVAAGFTVGELAVLCVIAEEHKRHGCCTLTVGALAYRAQVCRTIVQRALRQAVRQDLIRVDHRRVSRSRNLSNLVTLTSEVWKAWLRLGPRRPRPWGGGWVYESEQGPGKDTTRKRSGKVEMGASQRFRPKTVP